jgi:hypothetical protein
VWVCANLKQINKLPKYYIKIKYIVFLQIFIHFCGLICEKRNIIIAQTKKKKRFSECSHFGHFECLTVFFILQIVQIKVSIEIEKETQKTSKEI